MKSFKRWCLVFLLLSAIPTVPVVADIYRYKSEDGVVHYTDAPTDSRFVRVKPGEKFEENTSVTPPASEKQHESQLVGVYLLGVVLASMINAVRLFISIVTGFSQRIKNIKKIGGHYNLTEGQVTKDKPSPAKVAFYIADILIITPLLSWLYVCYFVFAVIKGRINRVPVPEKIKEINFKLSTANLPKETVKQCLNEMSRFYHGQDIDFRMPYDEDDWRNYYCIMSGYGQNDWNVHLDLDKNIHIFIITSRDPDFGEHIETFEYRFEGTILWTRNIERKHKYPDHVEYEIRDGVVLEQEYRESQKGSIHNTEKEIKAHIQNLHSYTEWSEHNQPQVRYFVLFRHDDILDDTAALKFFRLELKRIQEGYRQLERKVEEFNCKIVPGQCQMGNTIIREDVTLSDDFMDSFKSLDVPDEIREILHGNGLGRYGLTLDEFRLYEQVVEDLKLYISKL